MKQAIMSSTRTFTIASKGEPCLSFFTRLGLTSLARIAKGRKAFLVVVVTLSAFTFSIPFSYYYTGSVAYQNV
jgi:hypothetical protein